MVRVRLQAKSFQFRSLLPLTGRTFPFVAYVSTKLLNIINEGRLRGLEFSSKK